MIFTLIFVGIFVTAWLICGFLPWLALSVVTRGHAGLSNLPLALFGGVVGGLAVPYLIRDDGIGIIFSLIAAVLVSAGLLAARRFAATATGPREPTRHLHNGEHGK